MSGFEQTVMLLRQQLDSASRSDALRPLAWLVGLLVTAVIGLTWAGAPWWSLAITGTLLACAVGLYGFAYVYCLFNDRDALRSDKFAIQKLAIERGVYGDDLVGTFVADDVSNPGTILIAPEVSPDPAEDDQAK